VNRCKVPWQQRLPPGSPAPGGPLLSACPHR
jgi:hypothetical protein